MAAFNAGDLKRRMEGALDSLHKEFVGLRTGRASSGMLDPVQVEAYGSLMPLNQLASISVPEPRMLSVQVWDSGTVKHVEKAIREAGLGLNPQTEGNTLRIPVPPLNEERRLELVKVAGKYAEAGKVAVRNVRRDGMEMLKKEQKDGAISEDEHKRFSDEVQKLTDGFVKKIDDLLAEKEKDIKTV